MDARTLWLARGFVPVDQGSRIEATQNLPGITLRFLDICFLFLSLLPMLPPTLSLQLLMKFGNVVQVETSRFLTKIMTLQRKANREQLQVLAAKHTASLQLLCTAGGNQARSDARTEFKIRYAHPTSLDCHQLYIVIEANACAYTQGLFWLPWGIILV